MSKSENRQKFYDILTSLDKQTVSKIEIVKLCEENDMNIPQWFVNDKQNRIERGLYRVPSLEMVKAQTIPMQKTTTNKISNVTTELDSNALVPEEYPNYVPFGNFKSVQDIIKSKIFFPVLISGHSGNGKTMSIEQACAKEKRKFICISMTPETDESDLLGNYVLIDGNMVWRDGPVTTAAREGAVLCIDEIDYGAQNLSSLQRVLEGKPFLLKKKGEVITPKEGFNIFATANTKGKGSDDGRYMFTNVLNEAFLERFPNTMEQDWPTKAIEIKIIRSELKSYGFDDDDFSEKLVVWANVIRDTFNDEGCDEVISTRRLVHIIKSYAIYKDKMKAIEMCLNRFEDDTKASFLDLYTKIDSGADVNKEESVADVAVETPTEPTF